TSPPSGEEANAPYPRPAPAPPRQAGRRLASRQEHREGAPPARLALQRQAAFHQVHQPPADREPEPGALTRSYAVLVDLGELLEHARLLLRGDADPAVHDGDGGVAVGAPGPDVDPTALTGELHGVREQVQEHLLEAVGV